MRNPRIDRDQLTTLEISISSRRVADQNYRLDIYLTKRLRAASAGGFSRTLIQQLIKEGLITVNQQIVKPSYHLHQGDRLTLQLPRVIKPQLVPEEIPLDIIYEDPAILVVNKPPGMVVHPAAGHWQGTLVNALLHHCGVLPQAERSLTQIKSHQSTQGRGEKSRKISGWNNKIYRPGIVHRLDKNTSGVILSAKTAEAHASLTRQFEKREVEKEYLAMVEGVISFDSDIIEKSLGRHKYDRKKMAVQKDKQGRPAFSFYEVMERFRHFTVVKVFPKTGRTHQIRVHLAAIGHPIVADATYGVRKEIYLKDIRGDQKTDDLVPEISEALPILSRQALHAHKLSFTHPVTKQRVSFTAELPVDMRNLWEALKR